MKSYGEEMREAKESDLDNYDPLDQLVILAIKLERFARCGHNLDLADCHCDLEYQRVERELLHRGRMIALRPAGKADEGVSGVGPVEPMTFKQRMELGTLINQSVDRQATLDSILKLFKVAKTADLTTAQASEAIRVIKATAQGQST